MKTKRLKVVGSIAAVLALLCTGCASPSYTTTPYQPGPVAGRAIGSGAGAIVGNAAGAVVGAGEGVVSGVMSPFDTTTHLVRRWHTEITADGRTIQVPEDILVDANGRPVNPPPPQPAVPSSVPSQLNSNFSPK